jgi:hypothetical protein
MSARALTPVGGCGRSDAVTDRNVAIEISGTAWSSDPRGLPEDTRDALATDGRTELLKVLGEKDPPAVIRCSSVGCTYLASEEVDQQC